IFTTAGHHHHGHDDNHEGHGDHEGGHGDGHDAPASNAATLQYVQISSAQVAADDTKEVQSSNATPREAQQTDETTSSISSTVWIIAILVVLAAIFALVFVKRKK
uniref:LPXTG cell wall anchor domain-containing protein n=1 Tax=Lysinibacillus sp. D4A3_S15 TaxID=2941227 RepID=UPI0020C0332C